MKISSLKEDLGTTLREAEVENAKSIDEKQEAEKTLKAAILKFASLQKALYNKEEQLRLNVEFAARTIKNYKLK